MSPLSNLHMFILEYAVEQNAEVVALHLTRRDRMLVKAAAKPNDWAYAGGVEDNTFMGWPIVETRETSSFAELRRDESEAMPGLGDPDRDVEWKPATLRLPIAVQV